jgi:Protein of unknown function (DUF3553)
MSRTRFEFGDQVRHTKRPEWGVGAVVKAEDVNTNGQAAQRLSVRFPGEGIKTLSTEHAELELVPRSDTPSAVDAKEHPVARWDRLSDSDWLSPVARRKIEEAMTQLPEEVGDPFRSVRQRVAAMIDLYRFDRSGRGLIDWAVAQTALADPLSRFNRHELEQYFDRWAWERDAQLGRLLQELNADEKEIEQLLTRASASARETLKRLGAVR